MTLKPFGRSLSEFEPLKPAEKMLLDACRCGHEAIISEHRPKQPTEQNIVRANFVRFLALGGDENAPVHEQGVWLQGAWIEGELNLSGATLPHSLMLINCHLSNIFLLDSNVDGFVSFQGCHIESLQADRMVCDRDVILKNEFIAARTVTLTAAQIGGSLDCRNAKFNDTHFGEQHIVALVCDRAVIKGGIFLNSSFFFGTVRLMGIKIGSNLECDGSTFDGKGSSALICESALIKGGVFLRKNFIAIGTIYLSGTQIDGNLDCINARLDGAKIEGVNKALALVAENMTVVGTFFFYDLQLVKGIISLVSTKVGSLEDDFKSWSQAELHLNGFIYDKLVGRATTNAKSRIEWLNKQIPAHLNSEKHFKPQPWQQLQKVFREMGHFEDARQVGIAFEEQLRKADLIGQTPEDWCKPRRWLTKKISRGFHWSFGKLIGYGYRPLRPFLCMCSLWLACGLVYWLAAVYGNNGNGVFAPTSPAVFQNAEYNVCKADKDESKFELHKFDCTPPTTQGAGNWYLCEKLRPEYTGFSPFAYSLDLILPVVDLQQENDWSAMIPTPDKTSAFWTWSPNWEYAIRFLMWLEILFGWVASLLLVAVVSGLTKRREE